jgi:hypothetical protein
MQFIVESTGIADWFSILVTTPQRGHGGLAVSAARARPPRRRLQAQRVIGARLVILSFAKLQ